jgi:hypothetical protein
MILYPQIPHAVAQQLVDELRALPITDAQSRISADHADMYFTPTGGTRATKDDLMKLRGSLAEIAIQCGYPQHRHEAEFDKPAAAVLHAQMKLSAAEASKPGIWEFLCCVLLCDLVRWRFSGDSGGTSAERFLASRRNTFQRLWWRAFVLQDAENSDPYHLLGELGEDETVQIMERPFLAGSRELSRTVARELIAAAGRDPDISRRTLIRESQKRLRRLGAFVSFEAIDQEQLKPLVRGIFDQVREAAI